MRRSFALPVSFVLLGALIVLAAGGTAPVSAAEPAKSQTKVSLTMTILEASGAPLAERKVEARVGTTEAVFVQQAGRTISVDTTISPGRRPGCYKIDLVVRDRTIDVSSNRFGKTVWQSATEPCDGTPITLGPKEEVQVRIVMAPPPKRP